MRPTDREDLSRFLVHLTCDFSGTTAEDNLLAMLKDQRIEARSAYCLFHKKFDQFAFSKVLKKRLRSMTGALEQKILTILRERRLFEIASRTHAKWKDDLEAKYPRSPHGGLNPIIRSARTLQGKIGGFGPEALIDDLLPHFVYAAERWQQMTDLDVAGSRPYLRYVCACLPDSRPGHLEKHGLVFPVDHHFWDVWYPLNGLGCMCTVVSVSKDLVMRRGWRISENRRLEFKTPDEGFDFNIGKIVS